jgi:hypothetical protein
MFQISYLSNCRSLTASVLAAGLWSNPWIYVKIGVILVLYLAIKRQDPLAFVGNGFYRKSFSSGDIDPGDEIGFSVGVVLAASPETSLQASLLQSFTRETKINGREIPGSDQTSGVFTLGASSILGRGVLLSITGGIGLTSDAPDYFVGISLPIAFDVPKF